LLLLRAAAEECCCGIDMRTPCLGTMPRTFVVSLHAVCRLPVIDGSPAYLQAEAASRLAGFLPTSELAALEGLGTGIHCSSRVAPCGLRRLSIPDTLRAPYLYFAITAKKCKRQKSAPRLAHIAPMNRCRGLQRWTQLATRNSDGAKLRSAQNRSHISADHPCERLTTFPLPAWTGRYSPSSELRTDPTVRFPTGSDLYRVDYTSNKVTAGNDKLRFAAYTNQSRGHARTSWPL